MRTLMQSFLVMLATVTDRELAKQVQYLKMGIRPMNPVTS